MQFPSDIEAQIKQFAQPCAATLRPNWREGSCILKHIHDDPWWIDYSNEYAMGLRLSSKATWCDWCQYKMIIGPPRYRRDHELCGLDEDYMNEEDIERHYIPWIKTWPAPDDHSWCNMRGVPEWAKTEYLTAK